MARLPTLALTAVLGGGCYAPTPAEGLPCSGAQTCPQGQQCDVPTQRCYVMPPDGGASDGTLDAATDALFDDFERADGVIGNGWIEKRPGVFALSGGRVVRTSGSPTNYRDNLVYRPSAEDVRDVEISVQVRFAASPPGYAQIFVRGAASTIGDVDAYDGYLMYVDAMAPDQVVIARQRGTVFAAPLAKIALAEPLLPNDRYRLTLRAEGASPVRLSAEVAIRQGNAFTQLGAVQIDDSSAEQIVAPGTVGFAGDDATFEYAYDDFARTPLAP